MRLLFVTLVRTQATRTRLLAAGTVGLLMAVIGLAIGLDPNAEHLRAGNGLVNGLGLGLIVPALTLVFASATLGDLVEDHTLVYIWLRPVARWRLAAVAVLAATSVSLPLAVVPVGIGAALSGGGTDLVSGAVAAASLAVIGYAALFVGLGLMVKRALAWGLVYVVLWEGLVASIGTGPARLSIHVYGRSLLEAVDGVNPARGAVDPGVAVAVVAAAALGALCLTAVQLARIDVA